MDVAHLEELKTLEERYWWHVAKRHCITQLLRAHVPLPVSPMPAVSAAKLAAVADDHASKTLHLHSTVDDGQKSSAPLIVEGGIGAAGNLKHWKSCGYRVAGLDILPESIAAAKHAGLDQVHLHDLHQNWPIEENSASAVVLLDVLEHLQEPVTALRKASAAMKDDGKLFFTVPAHPHLYCDWDARLGHVRRYTWETIHDHAQAAGLRVIDIRWWNAISLPIANVMRLYRKIVPKSRAAEFPRVGEFANRVLLSIQVMEHRLANYCRIPCGLSILGVMSK